MRSRLRYKNRKQTGTFVQLPHALMDTPNWRSLSPYAVKLLIDLLRQYRGYNNGDFTAAWSVMRPMGWRSKATLHKSLKELEWYGWIDITRPGGLHKPTLYGVTFYGIDECKGKLDVPACPVPSGRWKSAMPAFPKTPRKWSAKIAIPPHPVGHTATSGGAIGV